MEIEKLKNKAAEAFAKGKFERAAELYGKYCQGEPRDLQARIRMGDAWAGAGERAKAIAAYQAAAEGFARDGFFPRAIAAGKLVFELEPTHESVQQMLADLYAQKGGAHPPVATSSALTSTVDLPSAQRDTIEPEHVELEGDLSSPAEAFTELELGESLLHAVERAARVGAKARARSAAVPAVFEAEPVAPPQRHKPPEVPLFSDLPPQAFIELFERGPLLRFKKGQRIFEQGGIGQSFFIVCQGSVRVVREENGTVRELAKLPEGSFFGEMALLSDNPRIASVEAASDEAEVLEIPAALLSQLSSRHPSVASALRKFCRQRLLLNVMNTSALFQPFDGKDRRALVERFRAREVSSSTAIIREGQRSDGLYVILSGEVRVSKEGRVLAHLREADVFGEMSLLQKAPAVATVTALRRTSLLRLPREDFDEIIMSHPQILVLVSELTEDRRRQTDAILSGTTAIGAEGLILI
ncbi:MAG TPA: cyclic nucleotide-binding domain-containing protein [Myxococcaceae bacterium]|nr:cyclic nucleotide-binding domain-containing protein [Myxococcaceae bacterium]